MKTHTTFTPPLHQSESRPKESEEDLSEGQLRSVNPVNRRIIGEVEVTAPEAALEVMERAREAQRAWMRRPLSYRIERARSVFQDLLNWRGELLDLIVDETGKSAVEARWELWNTCEEIAELCDQGEEKLRTESRASWFSPVGTCESSWHPLGVVVVVASAYEPLQTAVGPALSALIAGNAVVIVADRDSPLTVQSVANIAATSGVPDALCQAAIGGRRLVDALADRADGIVSYGSSTVTRRLARRQGGRMIPVLGRWTTRDVMVVLSDADIKAAARAAVSASCSGAGRRRRALRRIYVQDTVLDPFVDAVVEEVGSLRQLHRGEETLQVGPLFEEEDVQKIEHLVQEASTGGARLVAGGRARPRCQGAFFEPTVLTGVDETMGLWTEDVPGPVVAIAQIRAPAEAVMRTRSVEGYGAVSIFSKSRTVAQDLARRMKAPVVGINEVVCDVPASAPMVRGCIDGPYDPVGADRLRPLSRRVLQVERRWSGLARVLEARSPEKMERFLDSAIALVHRRGWVRRTVETVWPPR